MSTEGYIDLYLLPVSEQHLDAYHAQATGFGEVVKEHGALSYREFLADDLSAVPWPVQEGMVQTAAVVEFQSRAHRDEVMGKVMADPRVGAMTAQEQVIETGEMRYGGFATFVAP